MPTSKCFHFAPLPFSLSKFEKKSSFLTTTLFVLFILQSTLVGHPFFFNVIYLNYSSLIFIISLILFTKLGLAFQEILHPFHTWDPNMWRLGIPSYYLKCTIIEHSQRWFMIGRDNRHLLEILIPPLWLWEISMIHGSTKMWKSFNNKLHYPQTTLT